VHLIYMEFSVTGPGHCHPLLNVRHQISFPVSD